MNRAFEAICRPVLATKEFENMVRERYAAQKMYTKSLLGKAATAMQLVNLARRVAMKRRVGAAA